MGRTFEFVMGVHIDDDGSLISAGKAEDEELVRCKDCLRSEQEYDINGQPTFLYCGLWGRDTEKGWFCSEGERRKDDDGRES